MHLCLKEVGNLHNFACLTHVKDGTNKEFEIFFYCSVLFPYDQDVLIVDRRIRLACLHLFAPRQTRDNSFESLQLCNLSHATECLGVCTKRTIVTFQMNQIT